MQIAVHILAYNVNLFLKEVIENSSPHVDKIFIAHPKRPWAYNLKSRNEDKNPTSLEFVEECSKGHNVEIIQGDWMYDEDTRNACFNLAKSQGFDWFITQDADEFYDDEGWDIIIKELKKSKNEKFFISNWYNFWKSSQYVIMYDNGSIKGTNSNFALRCLKEIKFFSKRKPNLTKPKLINADCYHYSMIFNDLEMKNKIESWGHTNEFNHKIWYQTKWLNWNENTLYLNPSNPRHWKKAIKFPYKQPFFSEKFSSNIEFRDLNVKEKINDFIYDIKSWPGYAIKRMKKKIRYQINVIFK
jgi:hypothetical protein